MKIKNIILYVLVISVIGIFLVSCEVGKTGKSSYTYSSPTPSPTSTPTPSPSLSPTPSPSPSPSTTSPSPTPSPTPSACIIEEPDPCCCDSPTPSPSPTGSPASTPTDYTIHTVQASETLSTIAPKYGLTDWTIIKYYADGTLIPDQNKIDVGDRIRIPKASSSCPGYVIHTVKSGETLSTIAPKYGLDDWAKIKYYADGTLIPDQNKINIGDKIRVPKESKCQQPAIPQSQKELLAAVLVLEAGGETASGAMEAVLNVIANRVGRDPAQYYSAATVPEQFSALNGRTDTQALSTAKNHAKWNEALKIVDKAAKKCLKDNTKCATHYHVYKGPDKVTPSWTHPTLGGTNTKAIITTYIGNHAFLKNVD